MLRSFFNFHYNFDPVKAKNTMLDLYLIEESHYFEENTSDNEVFASPFFNHFSLSLNIKKRVVMRAMRKNVMRAIHASAADLLQIRIRSLDQSEREAPHHAAFMDICPTISHMC